MKSNSHYALVSGNDIINIIHYPVSQLDARVIDLIYAVLKSTIDNYGFIETEDGEKITEIKTVWIRKDEKISKNRLKININRLFNV